MPVNGVNPSANQPSSASSSSFAAFAENFDSFLTLLTAQLKNQDPLSPLSATEFTTQLVQFAEVEQSIKQSKSMDTLIALQAGFQLMNSVNYIGKAIEAKGEAILLEDGRASFGYTLEGQASETTIKIKNGEGEVVRTISGAKTQGAHLYEWDGRDDDGELLPDGTYSVEVSAKNDDETVTTSTTISGTVTGVDMSGDQVILLLGDTKVPIADVIAVRAAQNNQNGQNG